MIGVLTKMIICGILVHVIASLMRHVKLTNILILKVYSCEKRLIGKLILECEDEILNATENSLDDEIVTCKKCLIHTTSLVITCFLLLAVISNGCYYY